MQASRPVQLVGQGSVIRRALIEQHHQGMVARLLNNTALSWLQHRAAHTVLPQLDAVIPSPQRPDRQPGTRDERRARSDSPGGFGSPAVDILGVALSVINAVLSPTFGRKQNLDQKFFRRPRNRGRLGCSAGS